MDQSTASANPLRQYALITANYWAFTLTDGALRMLVVLHFHVLGYSPLQIALLFIFYELFGVVTNLLGGWLGAHIGLNRIMNIGLGLQVLALAMLLLPTAALTVPWVMLAQAVSGIAKDLNKMSAKSAVKLLVSEDVEGRLYRMVAWLTGSKNTLKGIGFFLGGALLTLFEFRGAVLAMVVGLTCVWLASLVLLQSDLGRSRSRPGLRELFSKSPAINNLSAARLFLFGARDVWFVIALPLHLSSVFGWDHYSVGGFLALWIIGYGAVQALAPQITGARADGSTAFRWAAVLAVIPAALAFTTAIFPDRGVAGAGAVAQWSLIIGLMLFAAVFAVNSSLHSYLILSFAKAEAVSLDVGFYYMANAMGRLLGTLLSGWLAQVYGLQVCLIVSTVLLMVAALVSLRLPRSVSAAPR